MILQVKKIENGDVFHTNAGGSATVIDYRNSKEVVIKHNDTYGYIATVLSHDLRRGKFRNPYNPTVCGVGFVGCGKYLASIKRKHTPAYVIWKEMLNRCYNPNNLEKHPTYIGCSVDKGWHDFQVFAEWFERQYRADGWHLDKDLIVDGNKIYSASTCVFIPHQLNTLLGDCRSARGELPRGVTRGGSGYVAQIRVDGKNHYLGVHSTASEAFLTYKKAKECNIKRMADEWRHLIDIRVYEALMNYDI